MKIVGASRISSVCILAMVYKLAICSPARNDRLAMKNKTTDPCKDFYDHVCSRWQRDHPGDSAIGIIERKVDSQLKRLVEEWSTNEETAFHEVEQKLSNYYESCLNNAVTPDYFDSTTYHMLSLIISHNGHWPITLPKNEWPIENNNLSFQTIHEYYADIVDKAALFDIDVAPMFVYGARDSKMYPALTFPKFSGGRRDRYRSEAGLNISRMFINRSMPLANENDIKREVKELMAFEQSLFKLEQSTNSETLQISDIQSMWEQRIPRHSQYWMNWTDVIGRAFATVLPNVVISDQQYIAVKPSGFLERLADLLNNYTARTVVNYIHWSAMVQLAPHISQQIALSINGFEKSEKYRRCLHDGPMNDHGMSYLYVKKYIKHFERTWTLINSKVNNVKAELKRKISQSWMDDDAKSRIHEVIDNMVTNIGYPMWYDDAQNIEEYMSDVRTSGVIYS